MRSLLACHLFTYIEISSFILKLLIVCYGSKPVLLLSRMGRVTLAHLPRADRNWDNSWDLGEELRRSPFADPADGWLLGCECRFQDLMMGPFLGYLLRVRNTRVVKT